MTALGQAAARVAALALEEPEAMGEEEEEQGRLTGGILPDTEYPALQGNGGPDGCTITTSQPTSARYVRIRQVSSCKK